MIAKKQLTIGTSRPRLVTALSIFFLVAAMISLTASISLLCPNSFLRSMWRLNSRAHEIFQVLGSGELVY